MRKLIEWLTNLFPLDSHQSRHCGICHWIGHPLPRLVRTWLCPGGAPGMGLDPEGGLEQCVKEEAVVGFVQIQRKKNNKQSKRKCGRLKPECQQLRLSPVLCELCSGVTRRVGRGTQKRVIRKQSWANARRFLSRQCRAALEGFTSARKWCRDHRGGPENVPWTT